MTLAPQEIASYIDHTNLKVEATEQDIIKLCEEANKYHFKTVCVRPDKVKLAVNCLKDKTPKVISVVGFPTGKESTNDKAKETKQMIKDGAEEVDMVINYEKLKAKEYAYVYEDIKAVVDEAKKTPVKVIIETCFLDEKEKIIACALSKAAGASFVKTSTGFGTKGATVADVKLMREVVGPNMGVKASGGIKSYEDAKKMIDAGATRLGTSSSIAIVEKNFSSSDY